MAFTVEDGTGIVGANAYATEAEYDDYNTDRGTTISPALTSAEKQAAIMAKEEASGEWKQRVIELLEHIKESTAAMR